jgi:hypothetical protein
MAATRAARGGLDGDHVHPVDGLGGDVVGGGLGADIGLRFVAPDGRAHGVAVVFADEEHGQVPQLRQVQRLVELAFRHRAVAEETGRDTVLAGHLVGQRKPTGQRQAAAHDGIAAVELRRGIEQVHRPAAPAGTALRLAVHLGHDGGHRDTAHQRLAVFAIGCDDPVAIGQDRDDPGRDRLLPVIEMQEAADLLLRVKLRAFVLEFADADHVSEQVQNMGPVEMRFVDHGHVSSVSNVEMSPSGRPSSRAFRRRRMILPERVLGRVLRNTISRGATAGPSFLRACPRMAVPGPHRPRTRGSA